jgi:lysophospholipase L1-like esterase
MAQYLDMKKNTVLLLIFSQIALFGGIFIIVNVLQSQQSTAPQNTSALSTNVKVATVGDSISVDPPGSDLYNHYPSLLKSVYGVSTSDSFAVGASQTGSSPSPFKGMRLQYSENVAGKGYDALIIMGGVNDVASGVSASTTEANLDWMYSQAKTAGMKVVAISILPWGCFSSSSPAMMVKTKEINAWIKTNSNVDFFIDAYDEFNDGNDCLKASYNLDNIHVNRAGHDKLALMIYNQVFQGITPTGNYMQCGELGCTARGDDAACGWPSSGIECKSGYNSGEGRCEVVCTGNKVKTDPCTCSDAITPTLTNAATVTPTNTPIPNASYTPTPTVRPTTTYTPIPTNIYTPTSTVAVTSTRTATPTNRPTATDNTIPRTDLDSKQTNYLIVGIILLISGLYLKSIINKANRTREN